MTAENLAAAMVQIASHGQELEALRERVADLAELLEGDPGSDEMPYRPGPAPRWWQLEGGDRAKAVDHIEAWVESVYRPGFGDLAKRLPPCWREHDLCLSVLDWLSELHLWLYVQPKRTASMLSGQAEWHTRFLPAAADLMAEEASTCLHGRKRGSSR